LWRTQEGEGEGANEIGDVIMGPVFSRELHVSPRRVSFFVYRSLYPTVLLALLGTAWLMLTGTQEIQTVGDMARFGGILFRILAPLQVAVVLFLSALLAASAVAQEKDRRTLTLLLLTRLTNGELVLGKLLAALLNVLVILAAGLPVFMFIMVLGGVSFPQVYRVSLVALATAVAAGSLGSTIALWRDRTFQSLAVAALVLVVWVGVGQALAGGVIGRQFAGIACETWAAGCSPLRAVWVAAQPSIPCDPGLGPLGHGVNLFLAVALLMAIGLNVAAMARIRVWNPSRHVQAPATPIDRSESIWGAPDDLSPATDVEAWQLVDDTAEAAGGKGAATQVASRAGSSRRHREVWDNPILWRETQTRPYGHKVTAVRAGYLLLWAMVLLGLHGLLPAETWLDAGGPLAGLAPAAARGLVPLFFVSLVIINALAVTTITVERDGRSLDSLLVTDLSPPEFLFGKLGGVLWITKEMVIGPLLLCIYLWYQGGIALENLIYVTGGLLVLDIFVAVLGLHCGMTYTDSRTAIGASLGAVFFLFLGVVTCIVLMISFSGSFHGQLAPFLALNLGGSAGLYVSLGWRNPSPAIGWSSLLLPFLTFYAITSYLEGYTLAVFLVIAATYGFATAAMVIPALSEFDVAMGRTTTAEE
jgi:ABC-type Na+ efflux pump permease subunit